MQRILVLLPGTSVLKGSQVARLGVFCALRLQRVAARLDSIEVNGIMIHMFRVLN